MSEAGYLLGGGSVAQLRLVSQREKCLLAACGMTRFFFLMRRRPPKFTLFPYTTLFRSGTSSPTRSPAPPCSRRAARARPGRTRSGSRSEEHTSELQSHVNLVCRLLLEKKKKKKRIELNYKKKKKNIQEKKKKNKR